MNFGYTAGLKLGDKVTVLRRTPVGASLGDWLQIITPQEKAGWVAAKYITIAHRSEVPIVPAAELEPTPVPVLSPGSPSVPNTLVSLDLRSNGIFGRINPYQEHWYTFSSSEEAEIVFTLMFTPNVNFSGLNFQAYYVQFFIHDQIQVKDSQVLENVNLGAGSYERDRDGNYSTGDLVWRSSPLPKEATFYLRIVNKSSVVIRYCLMPRDEYRWTCSRN